MDSLLARYSPARIAGLFVAAAVLPAFGGLLCLSVYPAWQPLLLLDLLVVVMLGAVVIYRLACLRGGGNLDSCRPASDESVLQELKGVSRLFFHNNASPMLIVSGDGIVLEANAEACRLFRQPEGDLYGLVFLALADHDDPGLADALEHYGNTGLFVAELGFRRSDDTIFPVQVESAKFRDLDGVEKLSLIIRDISKRKRVEESLRTSEAMLKEAQQIAHIGHWELNFITNKLTWSEEVYNIYEVDRETFEKSFDPFFNILSSEEKEKLKENYSSSLAYKPGHDIIHRFNFPGGRVKYVNEACKHFYDPNGKLLRSVGTVQDVTTRWLTEERLRQLSRVVEQSPVCVVITDVKGCITYVNPKFTELTGYSYDEAIGQNPRILHTGFTSPETIKALWETIMHGGEWSGEFCNRKKNGELYWEMAYISPVLNTEGETTHFVAVKENITARKQAETQLRELSLSDELTGLVNRRGFLLLAKQQIKVSDRSRRALALIFADMDGLKWINDNCGHVEGDLALRDTATVIKSSFRVSDIVARLGGDEFVVLSVEATEQSKELIVARLKENLDAHNLEADRPYKLSFSVGITLYDPEFPCTLDELIERGDRLMYEQKQKRKVARKE